MSSHVEPWLRTALCQFHVIPACPLALSATRTWDARRQRGLIRYYAAAGVTGLAVGVHTTQFAIRDARLGLFRPVLQLAAEELQRSEQKYQRRLLKIAGVCGRTEQALSEAEFAGACGYHAALVSLAAWQSATDDELIEHCRRIADVLPMIGFYLQPAAGGRVLSFSFWRRLAQIDRVVAIKIAPFNRYQTIDVVRAVVEAGRDDLLLLTGNDDHIIPDLLTPYRFAVGDRHVKQRIRGGLLGQWAVWTHKAVQLANECRTIAEANEPVPPDMLLLHIEWTDANAAIFDAANGFAGCIAGIQEVLRRQGLLESAACLDPRDDLSVGQAAEIVRVCAAYPHLSDDAFVREHLDEWLSG